MTRKLFNDNYSYWLFLTFNIFQGCILAILSPVNVEEDRLITEIARLKYNKSEYPDEALLNAVRDGMQAKCSDGESLVSVLIQEHALLMFQEDYDHDLGIDGI
jgi:hypothetical protein